MYQYNNSRSGTKEFVYFPAEETEDQKYRTSEGSEVSKVSQMKYSKSYFRPLVEKR